MLLNPGFWPNTYWADRYWVQDYWPEFGTDAVVVEDDTNTGWYEYDRRKYRQRKDEDAKSFDERITRDLKAAYQKLHGTETIPEPVKQIIREEAPKRVVKAIQQAPSIDIDAVLSSIRRAETKLRIYERMVEMERQRREEEDLIILLLS